MKEKFAQFVARPLKFKLAVVAAVALLLTALVGWFAVYPKVARLGKLTKEQAGLAADKADKAKLAADLPRATAEYKALQQALAVALTELPNTKEIPGLLTAVTTAGKSAGLDFLSFRPKAEEAKDFYAVIPVDVQVAGGFHQVAGFFASVATLPRIVNLTNVAVSEAKQDNGKTALKVSCLATTFRFLDPKEVAAHAPKKK